jgi:formylglycine-generating enzyme required for sulfatase activity
VPLPSGELPNQPSRDRDWYVNSLSMTMLKIKDPTMPPAAWFYLSDREVSTRLFKQYLAECPDDLKPKPDWPGSDVARSPTDEHPVQQVSWIDAVRFCNWLSLREGLTPCYEQHDSNWDLVASADGYRLPTEVEWECACRAGTTTVYASGDDVSLLAAYAVCYANQTAVCGSRLPNAWGVFDAHGNVYEWCQDLYSGEEHEQEQDGASREKANRRVLRGGAFDYDWKYAASAASTKNFAWYRSPTIGFRVARSYPDAARTPAAPALSPQ